MKILDLGGYLINIDKIIQIYEEPINPHKRDKLHTVIEIEGIITGNTGPYGEVPYYSQNRVTTNKSIDEVKKLIYKLNKLDFIR